MIKSISDRSKKILHSLINEYIISGEPIGSRTLSKKYNIDLSPASIRNELADLEELGFLFQPHTSAGRVPTDEGLRYYIDSILVIRKLTEFEKQIIDNSYRGSTFEFIDIMKETSRLLSVFSRFTGVVLAPKFENITFKHIEMVKFRKNQILTVLVSKTGIIRNKIIEIDEDLSQDELYKFSRYLNELLTDLTLKEARKKIVAEMKKEKNMYDCLLSMALKLSQKAFNSQVEDDIYDDDIYIYGKCNIFDYPEFCDIEKTKTVFRAFEEKSILIKILDQAIEGNGIQIFIGSENNFKEMQSCSIVASPYTCKDNTIGILGVIGPTRMSYSDIVPIVDYTAKTVSRIMDNI
ncbi:MAG: heat-inducible transcriptional repressor HrcA [Thermodesulfobacteriota bacterium]|nr:heat-inducible transcriptional repressor HrcA [Thermodesulfobacteriota bacterium]